MASSQHIDKFVRSFISGGNNSQKFDKFVDLQDPTYLSFKIDFFPDLGYSFTDDTYSAGGLFRKKQDQHIGDYVFWDSAAEYLARIGAPARQTYLEIFINLLKRIQNEAPWYFQSISGLGEFYKIDPANNFRGKDKVITIECLESIDLRMSLLADLYRNIYWDMQNMREVLPINLRTFNMAVHVLEFRTFNTTFGVIADQLSERAVVGQDRQQQSLDAVRKNVYNNNNGTTLFTGTLDNVNSLAADINNKLGGGLFNNGSGNSPKVSLESAFEAISVQTFYLKECEFDFHSEAPGYLETVSVKDIPEATHRFKIKVGKIQKTGYYSFDNYVISEYAKYSKINPGDVTPAEGRTLIKSKPYFEQTGIDGVSNPKDFYTNYRDSIFPNDGGKKAISDAYNKNRDKADELRKKPLENILGSLVRTATTYANQGINEAVGNLTGGILGTRPLGNVYGDPGFLKKATEALNDFLTPGSQITTNNTSAKPPSETLGNIMFGALSVDTEISPKNVGFEKPTIADKIGNDSVYEGTPPSPGDIGDVNVFNGTPPLPLSDLGSDNVYDQ